jgi:hypothetical protein
MNPRVLSSRGTRMKLERKWHEASCSVGMLSPGEMVSLAATGGAAMALAAGEGSSPADEEGLFPLPLVVLADDEGTAHPFLLAFCALLSVALVSFRNISSNSSL